MFNGQIDPAEPTPLYLQAAAEIRRAIAEGEAKPG
jgi:DNA-binding GntR family transcriptional regulator